MEAFLHYSACVGLAILAIIVCGYSAYKHHTRPWKEEVWTFKMSHTGRTAECLQLKANGEQMPIDATWVRRYLEWYRSVEIDNYGSRSCTLEDMVEKSFKTKTNFKSTIRISEEHVRLTLIIDWSDYHG